MKSLMVALTLCVGGSGVAAPAPAPHAPITGYAAAVALVLPPSTQQCTNDQIQEAVRRCISARCGTPQTNSSFNQCVGQCASEAGRGYGC